MFYAESLAGNQRFPGCGREAYPAGMRFPVKREEVNLNEKESPR